MTSPTIELNIRLDVMGNSNNFNHVLKREVKALALLGSCFHHRADFIEAGAKVPRLVAKNGAEGWDRTKLYKLAKELHQDCIAVYYPASFHGELVGPNAGAWGNFDLAKFQRLDMICADGESTGVGWDFDDTMPYRATHSRSDRNL